MFPKLWQAEDCISRCGEVIKMLADDEIVETKGEMVKITGERKEADVRQLTDLTADKVEGLMRANTRHLKPWVGGSRAKSNLWSDETTKLIATNVSSVWSSNDFNCSDQKEPFLK